jgi:hypothetical protein
MTSWVLAPSRLIPGQFAPTARQLWVRDEALSEGSCVEALIAERAATAPPGIAAMPEPGSLSRVAQTAAGALHAS